MRRKRPDEVGGADEANEEDAGAQSCLAGLYLGQPEPRVERGQDEDERERIHRGDEESDDAEREQRSAVPASRSSGRICRRGNRRARATIHPAPASRTRATSALPGQETELSEGGR